MKTLFIFFAVLLFVQLSFAQQLSYSDAAVAYNRLVIEKNDGSYRRVGNYKVIGSPFLFGEKHAGNLYAKGETGYNIYLSYNTYTQEVEFYSSSNPAKSLVKEAGLVDSFELRANELLEMPPMKFVFGPHLGIDEMVFFQILYRGPKYSLYKKYESSLVVVSTNYIQSELREFNITPHYVYTTIGEKGYKILKPNGHSIMKEFKKLRDLSATFGAEDLMYRRDETLRSIFEAINY